MKSELQIKMNRVPSKPDRILVDIKRNYEGTVDRYQIVNELFTIEDLHQLYYHLCSFLRVELEKG